MSRKRSLLLVAAGVAVCASTSCAHQRAVDPVASEGIVVTDPSQLGGRTWRLASLAGDVSLAGVPREALPTFEMDPTAPSAARPGSTATSAG